MGHSSLYKLIPVSVSFQTVELRMKNT
jgi:hypothetical protein